MKQQIVFLVLVLMSFCGFSQTLIEPDAGMEWSGTASFKRTTVSGNTEHRSKTTYTIEIKINKGIGQATAFYSVERSVDYKNAGAYTESGSCTRTDATSLAVTLTDDGKHYDIAIGVPACEGILSINNDGGTETRDFGMDETVFQLEYKKRGDDQNVLRGNEVTDVEMEGGTSTEIYTWNFTRNSMVPDLLVLSPDYKIWLPLAYMDEITPGSRIAVNLQLKRKDGRPLDIKGREFFVQLLNTSEEPGIAINYPPKALIKGKPDMYLADKDLNAAKYFDGQKFTIPCEDGESGTFQIFACDGGGYTTLEVKAILEDGTEIKGHYENPSGPTSIPYPYRDPGRKIAKAWLEANGNPNDADDKEVIPGTSVLGDGLSAYEEYRGAMTEKYIEKLSPTKVELGLRVDPDNIARFKKGINLFTKLTHITPVICYMDEMDDSRIFNTNGLTHRLGNQYGLYIKTKNLGNEKGEVLPESDFNTTRNSNEININTLGIMKMYDSMANVKKLIYNAEEDLYSTVAHYLCQAVGAPPHGSPGKGVIVDPASNPTLKIQYLLEDGKPSPATPSLIPHLVGGQANDASGDAGCIMCMNNKYEWAYVKNGTSVIYRKVPSLSPGKKLCTSAAGTLINSNGKYFGNAQSARGNCASRIKVRSW